MAFPDVLLYILATGVALALILIVLYCMVCTADMSGGLGTANLFYEQLETLVRAKRYMHYLLLYFSLLTGNYRELLVFNLPLLAWEAYESYKIRVDGGETVTPAKIAKLRNSYSIHLCVFIICFLIYVAYSLGLVTVRVNSNVFDAY